MKVGHLALGVGRWFGWLEIPARRAGWPASPMFLTVVEPLGTGKGIIRLGFIQPLWPVQGRSRRVDLRIVQHRADQIIGRFKDEDGIGRTAIISAIDLPWMASHCQLLWKQRPPEAPTMFIDGAPFGDASVEAYLSKLFGDDASSILTGAVEDSFGCPKRPMGERWTRIPVTRAFSPFDSWLIRRGFVPTAMEEKWFIYFHHDRLLFRRSWTGILIYDIEHHWREDRLVIQEAVVNRDAREYSETDDAHDHALLHYLIEAVLLGLPAPLPAKSELSAGQTALQAWAVAGKASI